MRLDGKVALVTGASRGIGRAIAVRLGQDGAAVVVNYSGNHEAARETVATIEAASGRAVAVQGDVGKVGDIQRLFDAAFLGRDGRPDRRESIDRDDRSIPSVWSPTLGWMN